jgi:hypothetical protein
MSADFYVSVGQEKSPLLVFRPAACHACIEYQYILSLPSMSETSH